MFQYNAAVSRVDTTVVHAVYNDPSVRVGVSVTTGFNGGPSGVQAHPTSQELAVVHAHHVGMTRIQQQHVLAASQDRQLLSIVNHNQPPVLSVERPLSPQNRPAGFAPVKPSDRVTEKAHALPPHAPAQMRPSGRPPAASGHPEPVRTKRDDRP